MKKRQLTLSKILSIGCCLFMFACGSNTELEESAAITIDGIGSNGTYKCGETPLFSIPSATSNCGGTVTLNFVDVPNQGGTCAGGGIKRIWTATDLCGDSATASQIMEAVDDQAPILSGVGPDGTYVCGSAPDFSSPTASDNCSSAIIEYVDSADSGGPCPTVTRTWTTTDECGNFSTASQTMASIDNNDDITFNNVGPSGTFVCGESPTFSSPTASSTCPGQVTISFVDLATSDNCASEGTTRTWTASDQCGNTATASQMMDPIDDIAPVISGLGGDGTFACGTTPVFSSPTASDNCSSAIITFVDSLVTGSPCDGVTRTWTTTDMCGNFSTASQTMTGI